MNKNAALCKKLGLVFLLVTVFLFIFVTATSFEAMAAGVNTTERANFNKTIAYIITAAISFFITAVYCAAAKEKNISFILLFVAVFIVNIGYAFGSASKTLEEALLANRISYMGAVFLPLFMLTIIMDECNCRRNKPMLLLLLIVSGCIFFLTMTPGYTPWYYESVELTFVDGGAKLLKTYGPLHCLYSLYLFLYFSLMIAVTVWAIVKRKCSTRRIPLSILALVFGNILIWYIEQKIYLNFEFLSISYIATELYLLSLYNTIHSADIQAARCADCQNRTAEEPKTISDSFDSGYIPDIQDIIAAWPAVAQLTSREIEVFKKIIINKKRKDIAEDLCVSENTVKKHTTNIFTKLGVSSRADIMNMLLKIK